jgi:hypothetical protein
MGGCGRARRCCRRAVQRRVDRVVAQFVVDRLELFAGGGHDDDVRRGGPRPGSRRSGRARAALARPRPRPSGTSRLPRVSVATRDVNSTAARPFFWIFSAVAHSARAVSGSGLGRHPGRAAAVADSRSPNQLTCRPRTPSPRPLTPSLRSPRRRPRGRRGAGRPPSAGRSAAMSRISDMVSRAWSWWTLQNLACPGCWASVVPLPHPSTGFRTSSGRRRVGQASRSSGARFACDHFVGPCARHRRGTARPGRDGR